MKDVNDHLLKRDDKYNDENPITKGTITKIEQQKRNKRRYNIYVNDEYAFSIHEDVLVSCRVMKGQELNESDVHQLLAEEEFKKMVQYGLRYLSYRPRTEQEMYRYLVDKGFHEREVRSVIEQFVKDKYIDDAKFATQWVKERLNGKNKGKYLLAEELRHKGIPQHLIESAIQCVDENDEIEACLTIARKKVKSIHDLNDVKQKHKLQQFLLRRGFSYDMIHRVCRILHEEVANSDEC